MWQIRSTGQGESNTIISFSITIHSWETLEWCLMWNDESNNRELTSISFPIRTQEDFPSGLRSLRLHGSSRRNSLLRWSQGRTQGYKVLNWTKLNDIADRSNLAVSHTPPCLSLRQHRPPTVLSLAIWCTGNSEALSQSGKPGVYLIGIFFLFISLPAKK